VKHRLGLGHRSTAPMSLLDAISFYRRHNGPAVQYGNDSAETTVVEEGQSQDVGFWGQPLSGSWPLTFCSPSWNVWCQVVLWDV